MRVSVGIDVAKEAHWATAVDDLGEVLLERRLPPTTRPPSRSWWGYPAGLRGR
jgi:hypothetical protein